MKTLIVYYSRTGVTKKLAQKMALELDADLEEVVDTDKRSGVIGYLRSGRDAMRKKLAIIDPLLYNPADYDLVIVGTPTWANTMACAIRTYLHNYAKDIKQVAFFATRGGEAEEKAIKSMAELLNLEARAELSLTSREVMRDLFQEKLSKFVGLLK